MTEHATAHKTVTAAPHAPVAPVAPGDPAPAAPIAENPDKSYVKTLVLSTLFGYFGVDRFYLNKVGTGVAKLLTFGGLGVWVLVDFIITLVGAAREKDKPNLELQDTQKYKPFFVKITLICVAIYVVMIVLEIVLFAFLATLGQQWQSGSSQWQSQPSQLECRDNLQGIAVSPEACPDPNSGQSQGTKLYEVQPHVQEN